MKVMILEEAPSLVGYTDQKADGYFLILWPLAFCISFATFFLQDFIQSHTHLSLSMYIEIYRTFYYDSFCRLHSYGSRGRQVTCFY